MHGWWCDSGWRQWTSRGESTGVHWRSLGDSLWWPLERLRCCGGLQTAGVRHGRLVISQIRETSSVMVVCCYRSCSSERCILWSWFWPHTHGQCGLQWNRTTAEVLFPLVQAWLFPQWGRISPLPSAPPCKKHWVWWNKVFMSLKINRVGYVGSHKHTGHVFHVIMINIVFLSIGYVYAMRLTRPFSIIKSLFRTSTTRKLLGSFGSQGKPTHLKRTQ